MFVLKLILATVFVIVSARFDEKECPSFDQRDVLSELKESYSENSRTSKQVAGSTSFEDIGAKVPLVSGDVNRLSAIGSIGLNDHMKITATGLGLQFENANGHSLTVMKQNIPRIEDSLTAAGKLNVFHNSDHKVDVRASVTNHMPAIPNVPDYNTVGGSIDYMYKEKVGASVGMASTPFLGQKEYSAMGNINIYRDPTTSVDLSGGFRKFDSPHLRTGWQPNIGLTYRKSF